MSRYDLFRRRIAPIAFGVAIVLLSRETCNKQERTHATIVIDFGDAAATVRAVDAELFVGAESLAHYHRDAPVGLTIGPATFPVSLPSQDVEVRLDVELGGEHRKLVEHFHADEGAVVTLPLGPELMARH